MVCHRCGRDNPEENEFCGRCGTELKEATSVVSEPDEEFFCFKHKREKTALRCGRCERPICTKCVVIGPAGPRCHECSKQNIAFRPGAVVQEAKFGLRSIGRLGPWGIYMIIVIAMMLIGSLRMCTGPEPRPSRYDYEQSESRNAGE